jgi:antitoxin PrlF
MFDHHCRNSYHSRMKTTVSEKGQMTIPKRLRLRLGLRKDQALELREERGRMVMTKKRPPRDAFDKYFGILNLGPSTDEIMILRGPERPK